MLASPGVDLLLIWGSPELDARRTPGRPTQKSKVDVLQIRGDPTLNASKDPLSLPPAAKSYTMCCKFEQLVLNALEGLSSLSDARNGTNANVLPCVGYGWVL